MNRIHGRRRAVRRVTSAAAVVLALCAVTTTAQAAAPQPSGSLSVPGQRGFGTPFTPTVAPTTAGADQLRAAAPSAAAGLQGSASAVAGPITRTEVLRRAQSWVDQQVPYGQTWYWTDSNGKYRQDCSGFVSMAWHLPSSSANNWGFTTDTLPSVSTKLGDSLSDFNRLKPGDIIDNILVDHDHQHVVLFVAWADSAHTVAVVDEEPGTGLTARQVNKNVADLYNRGFRPYRYDNIVDSPEPGQLHEVYVAGDWHDSAVPNTAGNATAVSVNDNRVVAAVENGVVHLLYVGVDGWHDDVVPDTAGNATAVSINDNNVIAAVENGVLHEIYAGPDGWHDNVIPNTAGHASAVTVNNNRVIEAVE